MPVADSVKLWTHESVHSESAFRSVLADHGRLETFLVPFRSSFVEEHILALQS